MNMRKRLTYMLFMCIRFHADTNTYTGFQTWKKFVNINIYGRLLDWWLSSNRNDHLLDEGKAIW